MKKICIVLILFVFVFLTACSSNEDSASDSAGSDGATQESANRDMGFNQSDDSDGEFEEASDSDTDESANLENEAPAEEADVDIDNADQPSERKIIYNADLHVEVENYEQTISDIQTEITDSGGYIVESRTSGGNENDLQEGMIQARIPQEHFQAFLDYVENGSMKVLDRTVTGQDVTEEFVDLQSRLKSKRVVEERLLSFMEDAEETEDLLKISNDLANVQEDIEQITGRMNYLQNKSDLATVSIYVVENRVNIPKVNEEELNTWEKTQQRFMESINFLISAASGLFVFFGGSLPILLLLAIIGLIVYGIIRKRVKSTGNNSRSDE